MSAAALAQLGIALLPLVTTSVNELVAWINSLKAAAQQSGEWTDAMDAAFLAAQQAKTIDPAYQPDKK